MRCDGRSGDGGGLTEGGRSVGALPQAVAHADAQ
jgi:hypothetical protein